MERAVVLHGKTPASFFPPLLLCSLFLSLCSLSLTMAMAKEQKQGTGQQLLDYVPFVVVILVAAHVIALIFWIYRLASDNPLQRRKSH